MAIINWVKNNLFILQTISTLISLIFLGFIIFFIVKLNLIGSKISFYKDVLGTGKLSGRRVKKGWKQVQARFQVGTVNQLKLAVLEADKILDEVLRMSGYKGNDLDERLSRINPAQLACIGDVLEVHKVSKAIDSDPGFMINQVEAERVIGLYKKAFLELHLIEE